MRILLCLLIGLLSACFQNKSSSGNAIEGNTAKLVAQDTLQRKPVSTDTISSTSFNRDEKEMIEVKTFVAEAGGFGYDVYLNGVKVIHQPHRPGVAGNQGFAIEAQAQKTGEFVASKIRNNIMPPSVTKAELDSLGVL